MGELNSIYENCCKFVMSIQFVTTVKPLTPILVDLQLNLDFGRKVLGLVNWGFTETAKYIGDIWKNKHLPPRVCPQQYV